jgi:hypothetical protein
MFYNEVGATIIAHLQYIAFAFYICIYILKALEDGIPQYEISGFHRGAY